MILSTAPALLSRPLSIVTNIKISVSVIWVYQPVSWTRISRQLVSRQGKNMNSQLLNQIIVFFSLVSFACRVDADCIAMIGFLVYNEKKEIVRRTVNQFEYSSLPLGESWRKIAKTYRGDESDYPVGASFLRFYHGGMTNERFYGRYGAKFAFNSVELQLQ